MELPCAVCMSWPIISINQMHMHMHRIGYEGAHFALSLSLSFCLLLLLHCFTRTHVSCNKLFLSCLSLLSLLSLIINRQRSTGERNEINLMFRNYY